VHELDFRSQALQLGSWLGWISILAVLGGLALDAGAKHRWLLLAVTLAAAAGNAAAMFVPGVTGCKSAAAGYCSTSGLEV
jgi:hypothetical protein